MNKLLVVGETDDYLGCESQMRASTDSISITHKGVTLAVGGILVEGKVGSVWSMFSPHARGHAKSVLFSSELALRGWAKDYGLIRMQVYVAPNIQTHYKFAVVLGFELEGYLKKVWEGKDMLLMART